MKILTVMRSGAFALVLAVTGLGGAAATHAGVITLNVSGSLSPNFGSAACSPACTLGGDIVINNTTGTITSADVTAAGFSPSVGPFTAPTSPFAVFGLTEVVFRDSASNRLGLFFATPTAGSLVGYTGGVLSTAYSYVFTVNSTAGWGLTSGSLTQPAAVPEPSSLLLLLLALVGLGGFLGIRRLSHRTAPC